MQTAGQKPYSFAGYTLDLRQRYLRSEDREIELRPKSFALLCYLVENAGRLVPKDELVKELWPNVIVTDESLARCVSDVRLALNDDGRRIIKTVPGQGYLLAAPVSRLEPRAVAPSPDREPHAAQPRLAERRPLTSRTVFTVVALLSIMIVGGGLWWLRSLDMTPSQAAVSATADSQPPPAALVTAVAPSAALARFATQAPPRMSIVVLPFTNHSGDPALEYFSDGFTENLTTDLSRISGSFVIARNTAYTYKSKTLSEKQIASELNVRYVLEGGVQKAGNHVRVNVQLIDGETGAHLWAERYDRDSADLLLVQDEITHQIANALNLTLIQNESDRSWRDHPSNPDSVDLTMRAIALMRGPMSPAINGRARQLYEQAVELDPKNVDALLGLAWTYTAEIYEGWSSMDTPGVHERIDSAVTRALAVNPGSAYAYQMKSEAYAYDNRRDWRGELGPAIDAAEAALAINPNRAITLAFLGRLYSKVGHPERTGALVEQAIRLSPHDDHLPHWLHILGMSQLQMGHNEDAIATFRRSLLYRPRLIISWAGLTGALYAAGRDDEAHDALIKWCEVAVSDGGEKVEDVSGMAILVVRVQLALLRLARWPYSLSLRRSPSLSKALFRFQADENLPKSGWIDAATLDRLGIAMPPTSFSPEWRVQLDK
jgi:TolB-like protein/DNA-binding winged helix-turn-helix (wHTH) protein/tetratricopeptide (TPR) repeat protein